MKLMPPHGSMKSGGDATLPPGQIVWYENDGSFFVGAVLGFKAGKYTIWNMRGREVPLPPLRIHKLPGQIPSDLTASAAKTAWLSGLYERCLKESEHYPLADLWSLTNEETRTYTIEELSELLGKKGAVDDVLTAALALTRDKIFFKRERDGFVPRPAETVEELRKAEKARLEKLRSRSVLIDWMKERSRKPALPVPPHCASFLMLLEDAAADLPHLDNAKHREVKEIVDLASEALGKDFTGNRDQRVCKLLEAIGHFTSTTNLALIRHRWPPRFSDHALTEAEEFNPHAPSEDSPREDLTHLELFTVDDSSTRDMDDALSLEQTESGYRLGVHITDADAAVKVGGALDEEARLRATSVYLPEGTLHMLPEVLAESKLSLMEGEIRPAMSCLFELDRHFRVVSGRIAKSFIKVAKRMTYDEVEALIDASAPPFGQLYEISVSLETERIERGASKVYKRDFIIDLDEDHNITLREIDEHGPARGLVAELMVLTNSFLADYAVRQNIPVVFRTQEAPIENETPAATIPAGPAQDYAERARLKKSLVSLAPGLHASLGLNAYIQATSPIRRYVDLCNQRQLLAHVRGAPLPYTPQDLGEILDQIEEPLGEAAALAKETRRFWLLKYLQRRMRKKTAPGSQPSDVISGTVIRTDLKNPLVELDEVFFPAFVRSPKPLQRGDRILARITAIDPRSDYLRLDVMGMAT